jgi:hypothetical protein
MNSIANLFIIYQVLSINLLPLKSRPSRKLLCARSFSNNELKQLAEYYYLIY